MLLYSEKYPWKKLVRGNIVEFWLKRETGSRWQVAEVLYIIDDVAMVLPWHTGREKIFHISDLTRVAERAEDYYKRQNKRKVESVMAGQMRGDEL